MDIINLNKYDVSVLVLTYNSDEIKLLKTLRSVLRQKNVSFEIIICDDGSKVFNKSSVLNCFNHASFKAYSIFDHIVNQGTVLNIYDGVLHAKGKYIKLISPGDFFYSDNSLKDLCDFLSKTDAGSCFTDAVYYGEHDGKIDIIKKRNPMFPDKFNELNLCKLEWYYIFYTENILGATLFYRKDFLLKYLGKIQGVVKYAEDTCIALALRNSERILYYPAYTIWYEYGTGISTNGKSEWELILRNDYNKVYSIMDNIPDSIKHLVEWRKGNKTLIIYFEKLILISLFKMAGYIKMFFYNPKNNADISYLNDLLV